MGKTEVEAKENNSEHDQTDDFPEYEIDVTRLTSPENTECQKVYAELTGINMNPQNLKLRRGRSPDTPAKEPLGG